MRIKVKEVQPQYKIKNEILSLGHTSLWLSSHVSKSTIALLKILVILGRVLGSRQAQV